MRGVFALGRCATPSPPSPPPAPPANCNARLAAVAGARTRAGRGGSRLPPGRLSGNAEWRLMTVHPSWRAAPPASASTWSKSPRRGGSGGWLAARAGPCGRDPATAGAARGRARHGRVRARRACRQLAHPGPPPPAPNHSTTPQEDRVARLPPLPHATTSPPPSAIGQRGGCLADRASTSGWLRPARPPRLPAHPSGVPPRRRDGGNWLISPGRRVAPTDMPCLYFCMHLVQPCTDERCRWPCHGGGGDGGAGAGSARQQLW